MAWLPRVLGRRAAAQLGVLTAVTALTLVTCSLLGSFALLLTTAQDHALGAALDDARPDDVALVADLRLGGPMGTGDATRAAVGAATGALATLAGDAPLTTTAWLSSGLMQSSEARNEPATYLAAVPDPALVRVVEGTVPAQDAPLLPPTPDGTDVVPVAVPASAAEALGWAVGDRLTLAGMNDSSRVTVEVTGVYELTGPRSAWRTDLLEGASHDPAFPLPESFGFATIPVWGPLLTPQAPLLDGVVPAAEARVTARPDLTGLTAAGSAAMRDRLVDGQAVLQSATDRQTRTSVLSTRLDDTLEGVAARLAATQTGVLVAGLALAVVGGAALLLSARLLSEQRTAGLALMAARGTSHGQLLALAALEAAVVAAAAALAAPWLAALLVRATSAVLAPPGATALPVTDALSTPALWWTCTTGAVLLAALLVVPVLRPDDADSDAPTTRPGRADAVRAVLARSGGTVALLLVAGVAAWQLDRYRTPSGAAGPDPVLVAAPALLLLACALLVVRALPVLARATDALAARSRRLVAPLAAWETGRRPDRAAGTVLLVTLAVASGTFAQVTLATWRTSQVEQAALAVGTDVRLTDVPGSPLDAAARVGTLTPDRPGTLQPVTDRSVTFGGADGDSESRSARLLAVDDASVLRGRVEPGAGLSGAQTWDDVVGHLGPVTGPAPGLALPGSASMLSALVTTSAHAPLTGTAVVSVVLEDEQGVRSQHPLATLPLNGTAAGQAALRDASADDTPGTPVRVVGLLVTTFPGDDLPDGWELAGSADLRLTLSNLTATDPAGTTTPVPLDGSWTALSRPQPGGSPGTQVLGAGRQVPGEATVSAGALTLEQRVDLLDFSFEGEGLVAAPGPLVPGRLPAVVTADLASSAGLAPGDTVRLGGATPFLLEVTGVVEHLPGGAGPGVLVRRDALQAAELAAVAPAHGPEAWWGTVPDDAVPALTAAAAAVGELRSLSAERTALLDGPDRVGLQAALWILSAAALLLAGAGVATSVAAGLRLRRLELARLQALGVPRATLVRAVLTEHGLLAAVGLAGGATVGALVAALLATALAVGPDGRVPVPDPVLHVPWAHLAALGGAALLVVTLAVTTTARSQVRQASADLLRLGADR